MQLIHLGFTCVQVMPLHFTVQAVVTSSELRFDRTPVDFGLCSIYQSVKSSVRLTNLSLLPQDFGFLSVPEVQREEREPLARPFASRNLPLQLLLATENNDSISTALLDGVRCVQAHILLIEMNKTSIVHRFWPHSSFHTFFPFFFVESCSFHSTLDVVVLRISDLVDLASPAVTVETANVTQHHDRHFSKNTAKAIAVGCEAAVIKPNYVAYVVNPSFLGRQSGSHSATNDRTTIPTSPAILCRKIGGNHSPVSALNFWDNSAVNNTDPISAAI